MTTINTPAIEQDEPELETCPHCGEEVVLHDHDEDACYLENETESQWKERMQDIADDMAFEAWRERDL